MYLTSHAGPGQLVTARYAQGLLVACTCPAGQARARAWARLPAEAEGYTLDRLVDEPSQRPALAAIGQLLRARRGWLTLAGGYGTGKTTLIYATLQALARLSIPGRYETAPDLLEYLRDSFANGENPSGRMQTLIEAPALAIDEIDKYNPTGWAAENLFRLINARYQSRESLITILGWNVDGQDRIPPYLMSRARDGRFWYVELSGPDLRPGLDPWDRGDEGSHAS